MLGATRAEEQWRKENYDVSLIEWRQVGGMSCVQCVHWNSSGVERKSGEYWAGFTKDTENISRIQSPEELEEQNWQRVDINWSFLVSSFDYFKVIITIARSGGTSSLELVPIYVAE